MGRPIHFAHFYHRGSRFIVLIVTERKYILIFGRPTSPVMDSGVVLGQRILLRYCVFKTCKICIFDTPVLDQFLFDFVWVKSNISPRPTIYPLKIFGRTTSLIFAKFCSKSSKKICQSFVSYTKSLLYFGREHSQFLYFSASVSFRIINC